MPNDCKVLQACSSPLQHLLELLLTKVPFIECASGRPDNSDARQRCIKAESFDAPVKDGSATSMEIKGVPQPNVCAVDDPCDMLHITLAISWR